MTGKLKHSNAAVGRRRFDKKRGAEVRATDAKQRLLGELKRKLRQSVKVRARLEASLAEYVRLHDSAPVGSLTLDRSGAIREINLVGRRLLSPARQSLRGLKAVAFFAQSDRRKFLKHLRLCRGRSDCFSTELRLKRKPGAAIWLELISAATRRKNGNQREYHCFLLDITERKQAERARQESEMRFRKLADSVPALIWLCNDGPAVQLRQPALAGICRAPPGGTNGRRLDCGDSSG